MPPAAIPLFQRAISLDPNFAMAYARLGTSYSNLGQITRSAENIRKAYDLRERVSERESFTLPPTTNSLSPGIWKQRAKPLNCGRKRIREIRFPHESERRLPSFGRLREVPGRRQLALKLNPGSGQFPMRILSRVITVSTGSTKPGPPQRKRKPTIWIVPRFTKLSTCLISCNTMRQEWSARRPR